MRRNRESAHMKSEEIRSELPIEYRNLFKLLSSTEKYLENLQVEPELLVSYRRLLRYLRSHPAEILPKIMGDSARKADKVSEKHEPELSERVVSEMPFHQILELASNPKTARRQLERIATVRFGVTRGGLSTLRTREALIEKLRTLIDNEAAHDSISRAAGGRI